MRSTFSGTELSDDFPCPQPADGERVELRHYSAALDEIWWLRRALEREAQIIEAHLTYKTFPKSRRAYAEQQVSRMRAAIKGDHTQYAELKPWIRRSIESAIGTLTRSKWEAR